MLRFLGPAVERSDAISLGSMTPIDEALGYPWAGRPSFGATSSRNRDSNLAEDLFGFSAVDASLSPFSHMDDLRDGVFSASASDPRCLNSVRDHASLEMRRDDSIFPVMVRAKRYVAPHVVKLISR